MNESDRVKLVKLLNLSTSDSDGEALAAIRKANSLLKTHRMLWGDVLSPEPPPKPRDFWSDIHKARMQESERIRKMLNYCIGFHQDIQYLFINSLYDSFEQYGRLTPKQLAALERAYKRLGGK